MSTKAGFAGFPLPAPDYGFNREFPKSKLVATKSLLDMGGEKDRNAVVARLESDKATVIITGGAVAEMEKRLPGGVIKEKDDWSFNPKHEYQGTKKGIIWSVAK